MQERADADDDRPWCLFVGLVAPHFPLVVPKPFFDLYPLDKLPAPKLHPRDGHIRHPWVEQQNAMNDSEAKFADEKERLSAIAAYFGLCSWLDHNVGRVLAALADCGLDDNTTVVYTSDHGDNVGARELWGKSNLYQESVAIPLIMAGPDIEPGTCTTPVSLLDLSETIADHFDTSIDGVGDPLLEIGEDRILLDCGGGVVDRLLKGGFRPSDIDILFFSHLHSDHMMDYARLAHAAWDEGGKPLSVIGPPPIGNITNTLFGKDGVFAGDLKARTELKPSQEVWVARGGKLPRPWPAPVVKEVQPGFVHEGNGWTVRSCEVPHAQPALICMALAVTDGRSKFVYSGDAAICPALEELIDGADLLLHWCYRLDGETMHPAVLDLCPTPSDIASMAARNSVKHLVLTHIRPHMDEPGKHADAHAAMNAVFDGPSEIAEDLKIYQI